MERLNLGRSSGDVPVSGEQVKGRGQTIMIGLHGEFIGHRTSGLHTNGDRMAARQEREYNGGSSITDRLDRG